MKKLSGSTILLIYFSLTFCINFSQISTAIGQRNNPPSPFEISAGLKEALEKGIEISTDRLSITDGFLGNLDVKIFFPQEAKNVENTLRSLGLNAMCDQVIISLNRAAEDAAIEAKPIFVDAIKQMSFEDVQKILLGEKNAATTYFQAATINSLNTRFSPVIETSLKKVDATKYWSEVMTRYNKVPFVKKVNTDLTEFVTQKAIEGLFLEIAKEEFKIREDINARTSPLLQKVFGFASLLK